MKKYFLAALGVLASATPALAHHPLAGQPMETFAQGLLSGIGHPLLGFDHLFFVIAIGVAALYTGYARLAPAAYIGAMLVGCLMMSFGIGLPFKEVIIGLSLLTVGIVVLSGRALSVAPAIALFAIFGLFHGSAFGDSIAAQEASVGAPVLFGYLIGLGVLQYGIALASGYLVVKVWKATAAQAVEARIAGAAVAGMGAFLTLENIEGMVFGALL
ncbi:HupE/UreJ family protein [Sneathiella marina]|uniref:HupE/UreJ family protein n=1 Tax=Sneathiella marina TaxID=2950108 RepID=A0ABY4WBA4_9PROT|nr:HupE/UreJ family protein [Sneathiella marina]USG62539.1 HupE/UreJ family protein [Sneathiella marina]